MERIVCIMKRKNAVTIIRPIESGMNAFPIPRNIPANSDATINTRSEVAPNMILVAVRFMEERVYFDERKDEEYRQEYHETEECEVYRK